MWTHRSYFPPCPGVRCGPALDTGDTAHWPHSRPAPPQLQTCNTRAGIPAWFVIIPGSSSSISPGGVCICLQVCTLPAVPPRPRLTELGAATPVLTFTPASPAQPAQPSPAVSYLYLCKGNLFLEISSGPAVLRPVAEGDRGTQVNLATI